MKTALAFFLAIWLALLRVLIGGGLDNPWSAIEPALPVIVLVAVTGTIHTAVRLAVFVGVFESLLMPGNGAFIIPVVIAVAALVGPAFRLIFSSPSPGSLMLAALAASIIYEAGLLVANGKLYYDIGAPDALVWVKSAGIRLGFSMLVLIITGEIYRKAVLRAKQTFIGVRSVV